MFALTSLVPLVVVAAPAHAAPKDAAEAEHTRLAEEMRRLAKRNQWRGVESAYQEMLKLEEQGVELTYEDHFLAAQAARALGDVTDTYNRLRAAANVKRTDEVANWLADIQASYGRVELKRDDHYVGDSSLTVDEMPMAPDQRATIQKATGEVNETGGYTGLLPFGSYTYGGKPFTVEPGGNIVRVVLEPASTSRRAAAAGQAKRRDGFRIDLGPIYTAVGASEAPGVRPQPFSGAGIRLGLGWEIEMKPDIGLVAEVGYHGMFGGEGGGEGQGSSYPALEAYGDALNFFYLFGGVSYWLGDLGIVAGPSWAGGSARTTGLVANCSGSDGPGCATVTGRKVKVTEDILDETPVTGSFIKAGGGMLGVYYGFMDMPGMRGARLGVSLNGGAWTDLATLYPWGQLALSIAPSL